MLIVLAAGGLAGLHYMLPITLVIALLLAVLVASYRQVIEAFPGGGGAYAVSKANLGRNASILAGAALVVDYILTVTVSIAAGVGALTSAFPGLASETIYLCLAILAMLTFMNLRGLGETARAFLLPTLIFIVGLVVVILVGLVHPFALSQSNIGHASQLANNSQETLGILLILKAFSAGCSALTGVEAIANGVPLFKEPKVPNSKRTELLLGTILGSTLIGLAVLTEKWRIMPKSNQTVLSQIMAISVGKSWVYYVLTLTTTFVLALAANTSYGGFPVLASLLAKDNFLPHRFSLRGDRQVLNAGVWTLTIASAALLIGVDGNTNELIPLFAIGVFIGFTLSQSGLVIHWMRKRPPRWQYRMVLNGTGAAATAISCLVFLFTKFTSGAWLVVIAIPTIIVLLQRVHSYYTRVEEVLEIDSIPPLPKPKTTTVLVPISQISILTQNAIAEALSLGQEVIAIYVVNKTPDPETYNKELIEEWEKWNPGVRLQIIHTDYASIVSPLIDFIDEMRKNVSHQIVVLIPVIVPDRMRYRILHNQLDMVLTAALSSRTDLIVARVKFPLSTKGPPSRRKLPVPK
ncbi:MAG: APC family permease [Actinomycetota bacterium]|nr:MAG: APC family permease [Actinomycetota bacterium]